MEEDWLLASFLKHSDLFAVKGSLCTFGTSFSYQPMPQPCGLLRDNSPNVVSAPDISEKLRSTGLLAIMPKSLHILLTCSLPKKIRIIRNNKASSSFCWRL